MADEGTFTEISQRAQTAMSRLTILVTSNPNLRGVQLTEVLDSVEDLQSILAISLEELHRCRALEDGVNGNAIPAMANNRPSNVSGSIGRSGAPRVNNPTQVLPPRAHEPPYDG